MAVKVFDGPCRPRPVNTSSIIYRLSWW